jgi:polyisoprenoid-binding protein YceI
MKLTAFLAALTIAAAGTGVAGAAEFNQWQADKSSVAFIFKQMNVPVEGRFKRFGGLLAFDPAKPAAARAEIEIELTSIDAGSAEANDEVAGKLWFDTKANPRATARFVSTAIKPLGNNRFDVAGKMSIKGRTREVTTPATYRQEGNHAVFEGAFVLKRADYGIGEGLWADFGTVANEVQIKFKLVAAAAGKK